MYCQAGKTLFVPTPGMSNHVLSKLTLPAKHTKRSLRTTVTRQGVLELSEPVDVDCVVPMDLVIIGSVAVSLKGSRHSAMLPSVFSVTLAWSVRL